MRVGGDVCNFVIKCHDCNIISGLSKNMNWVLELYIYLSIWLWLFGTVVSFILTYFVCIFCRIIDGWKWSSLWLICVKIINELNDVSFSFNVLICNPIRNMERSALVLYEYLPIIFWWKFDHLIFVTNSW